MSRKGLIDPESREPLEQLLAAMPGGFNAIPDVVARRAALKSIFEGVEAPEFPDVLVEDHMVPGPDGAAEVRVRTYRPKSSPGNAPGIYYIHGGGMCLGDIDGEDVTASTLSSALGAVVVSVDYRLAPEHPHPAPVEDCYAGLAWMAGQAGQLGIDPGRLVVYGGSAGGGLTIATALLARDRGGPPIAFMMPIYPMIDDRNETPSSHEIVDVGVWDRDGNIEAWQWYLGGSPADQYAAPARAEDLTALPPAYIDVGTVDLFRDEAVDFAQRLMAAGVPCELHVNPGAFHASEIFAPDAALSQRIRATRLAALRRALGISSS
ncbi:acetyl esterase/lipase [Antricoccus suffuscus]|uniref:Acetyl esterase/lipase n=1 Tax=Antricoccus suffuscus TaxID=1629062 RepID=A0A2T0ZY04_9ACTN|nr:alpha/beta hydrolase [Antricoccus suffuscus]PRZ41236.1 acetyl esterase/lipase [Antricoccus suffuscus]